MNKMPTIFVSVPISSFSAKRDATRFKRWVLSLLRGLAEHVPDVQVYCAAQQVIRTGVYSTPDDATRTDLGELNRADVVLFVYPIAVPTSALIELGYAIARQKTIICVTSSLKTLPFMAQSFHRLLPHFHLLEGDIFHKDTVPLIEAALLKVIATRG
ncbi:MAG: nucleoside 2-deoxyribosyltransferase domain-containing protein [Sulfuritalea sp.]|jgi:nucleoside 2-deoxyribosyltransferase|nr:nucleoside 2-deoxyribosyltransferase domain-containing protein [Sulfuritalea sp.]